MSSEQPPSSPPPGASSPWGSYDGKGGGPAASKAKPSSRIGRLDPLSQRLLRLAGLLSVLLVLVLLNAALNDGGGSSSSEQLEADPVASAAERLEDDMSARMSLYVIYNSPALPVPLTANGSGAYNAQTDRTRIALSVTNPITGEPIRTVQIIDGDVEYDSGESLTGELPPGKKWVRTIDDIDEDENELSFEEAMEMLSSSARTELVGRQSINGKTTNHYRGEIKISDVIDYLREKGRVEAAEAYEQIEDVAPTQISAEGWVDDRNLLRRMRMVMPMPGEEPGEPPITLDMRMDFFAFGSEPDIPLPNPASVVDGPIDEDDTAPAPTSVS